MDEFFIKIYKEQILDQIENAEAIYQSIINPSGDTNVLFRNIHYFIIHVSNVVKLIQPKISNDLDFKNYRMKQLKRKYPNVPDIDPRLIRIRNDFEHYDERIDSWIINSKQHNYADKNLGDVNPTVAIGGLNPKDSFRWYSPNTKILYFCGEEYLLDELYSYIQKVKKALG